MTKKVSLLFFENALKSSANSCDAWHLYSLVVDGDGSYHNMLLLRMLENSCSLSRVHSLVFIYLVADVTAVTEIDNVPVYNTLLYMSYLTCQII